jgi:adenine-specific DNA-methyltransferase
MMEKLTRISIEYAQATDLTYRKKMGQYFTPKNIRDVLMNCLPKINNPLVLEPSCGSGEFLQSIYEYFDKPSIDALELDKKLVKICKDNFNANIINADTLEYDLQNKYDFVIGNPPYFEFKPNSNIKEKYKDVLRGRPNIYSCFIKLGLDVLKDGGHLAYVVPTSMNSGAYFSKLRKYIIDNAEIEKIIMFDDDTFQDAQQNVMIIVLRKGKNTGRYVFRKGDITIFSRDYEKLSTYYDGKKSLKELGFAVKTGSIVWNQKQNLLTNEDGYATLIWAHNIDDGKIQLLNHATKKQFIRMRTNAEHGQAIVVNRITGAGKNAKMNVAIVNKDEWYAENHVNVVYKDNATIEELKTIKKQIESKETIELIKMITGNTQVSKTELENLIPIKI